MAVKLVIIGGMAGVDMIHSGVGVPEGQEEKDCEEKYEDPNMSHGCPRFFSRL